MAEAPKKPDEPKDTRRRVTALRAGDQGVFIGGMSVTNVKVATVKEQAGTSQGGSAQADAMYEGVHGIEVHIKGKVSVVPYGAIRNYNVEG